MSYRRRRRSRRRNYSAAMNNPRRRRAPRRRYSRRRRRNAGITPFVSQSNPLILSNPRRRRRRRNPKLNLKGLLNDMLVYVGGGGLGYAANQFGLSQIPNDWVRRGSQVATAMVGAYFMKGNLGAAFAGATMYPLIADLAMYTGLVAVPSEADLQELSADLEDALQLEASLEDDELYIDDFEPMDEGEEELVAW